MKIFLLSGLLLVLVSSCDRPSFQVIPDVVVSGDQEDFQPDSIFTHALGQLRLLSQLHRDSSRSPRSWNRSKHQLISDRPHVWTSGFYIGSLWLAYEISGDSYWRKEAKRYTPMISSQITNTHTHDLGFMLFNSLYPALQLTQDSSFQDLLLTAAETLSQRFSSKLAAMKSQDAPLEEDFIVIIDNLMNLELLCWAASNSGDSLYLNMAKAHASFTATHFIEGEKRCSARHEIIFDAKTGRQKRVMAGQGASPSSVWSRGQAWGIYGYTMLYRYLNDPSLLDLAMCMADFWLEEVPQDGIPYWDFKASRIPNEPRDAAAATIVSSALLELSESAPPAKREGYLEQAKKTLRSLSSSSYLLSGPDIPFILDHSCLNKPGKIDIDSPQSMTDYYFLEALIRLKRLQQKALGPSPV